MSNPYNPTYKCVFDPGFKEEFDEKPKAIKPFGLRVKDALEEMDIDRKCIEEFKYPIIPPWLLDSSVILDLAETVKGETSPLEYQSRFLELADVFSSALHIYTDGSKIEEKVGAAIVYQAKKSSIRLPNNSSIFTAELIAIDMALHMIFDCDHDFFTIFSDSLSALKAVEGDDFTHPLVRILKEKLFILEHELNKVVVFIWIPSHVGIKGNERADKAAKAALEQEISDIKIPASDFKSLIHKYIMAKWQHQWDSSENNKLYTIQPKIGEWHQSFRPSRREEIVLARLRIGHSHITHSYLLRNDDMPECVSCQCPLTINHILIDCVEFSYVRTKYFTAGDMRTLFHTVNPKNIFDFLKEIGLFYKI
jgi:ribonuclease HI